MATTLAFGPFRLETNARILFRGAEPTPLGQRAVALLALLLDRPGVPVGKDALIAAAWPGQAIEDSNLTVQIAAIRRTLQVDPGERFADVDELVHVLESGERLAAPQREPQGLIERHPVRFWQGLCLILLVCLLISLATR